MSAFNQYYNHALKELTLANMNLEYADVTEIRLLLVSNTEIESLNLQNNCLCHDAIKHIMHSLITHKIKLLRLNIAENMIGPAAAESVGKFIQFNQSLQSISIWGTHLGSRGASVIAEYIKDHPSLTHLNIHNNHMHDIAAMHLVMQLKTCPKINDIQLLTGNNCTDILGCVVTKLGLENIVH